MGALIYAGLMLGRCEDWAGRCSWLILVGTLLVLSQACDGRWGETNTCLVRRVGPESICFLSGQGLVGLAQSEGVRRGLSAAVRPFRASLRAVLADCGIWDRITIERVF